MNERRTLIVAEDCDEDFDTVSDLVRRLGPRVDLHRAMTGESCLSLLRAWQGPARPVLVLLDLNLPGLDGRETLAEIRADAALRDVPVVVLTSSSNPRDVAFCYRTGANAYHQKPVRFVEYLQVLQELFAYWLGSVLLPARARRSHE